MLADLPRELIGSVLMHLGNPRDVRSLLTSCKALGVDARDFGTYIQWKAHHRGTLSAMLATFKRHDATAAARLLPLLPKHDETKCFHDAISYGMTDIVQTLAPLVDINAKRRAKGDTALHLAVLCNRREIVEILVNVPGINVGLTNIWNNTPLLETRGTAVMNIILDAGADVNARGWHMQTLLCKAALSGDNAMLAALLARPGIDVNIPADDSKTPLHIAVHSRNLDAVIALLATPGVNVNAAMWDGTTALHVAVSTEGAADIFRALLAAPGIDVNARDGTDGTALHRALRRGNIDAVKALLAAGIDVNVADYRGITALHIAAMNKSAVFTRMLLTAPGVDPNSLMSSNDIDGVTPLHIAADRASPEVVTALLECPHVNVNILNSAGLTPLHVAVFKGDADVVALLLSAPGIDVAAVIADTSLPVTLLPTLHKRGV